MIMPYLLPTPLRWWQKFWMISMIPMKVLCSARYLFFGILIFQTAGCSLSVRSGASRTAYQINRGHQFDVRSFGAIGDGKTMDRVALQSAIDAASAAGGGVVELPPGIYLTGSLQLKSHVELHLESGAILRGSTSLSDYNRHPIYALLQANHAEGITISGNGIIDGQGRALAQDVMRRLEKGEIRNKKKRTDRPDEEFRPMLVAFLNCRNVRVSGVTLKDCSCWVQDYVNCENLVLNHVRVNSTAYWNNDGMDITDCRKVKVSNCDLNSDDDGICLKSESGGKGCYDVDISDCRIRSSASALKFGTASYGGFRKVHVRNLTIYNTFRSAVALESVDGGDLEDILVENIHATNTGNAIFMRLGHRNQHTPIGQLRNVVIRNVTVDIPAGKPDAGYETEGPIAKPPHNILPCSIVGLPGHPISNVLLENISISYPGGAEDRHRAEIPLTALSGVPECSTNYPEFSMFGELPAWGFYVRHAMGVQFNNVHISVKLSDFRPAMVFQDVQQLKMNRLNIQSATNQDTIALQDVSDMVVNGKLIPSGMTGKIMVNNRPIQIVSCQDK